MSAEQATVFKNPDGTRTARLYGEPIRWKDSGGAWRDFNVNVTTDRGGAIASGTPMAPRLAARADDPALVRVTNGPTALSFALSGASRASATSVGNRVTYTDALPGADLVYIVQGRSLKEEIVLKAAPTSPSPSWQFPLAVDGLTPRTETDGTIGFYDEAGKLRLFVPPGGASDASQNKATNSRVGIVLEGGPGSWSIRVTPDAAWLADPARVYPVRIDPDVHYADGTWPSTYDAFVFSGCGTCNFDGGMQTGNGYDFYQYAGMCCGGEFYSYFHYDMSPVMGTTIYQATWNAYSYGSGRYPNSYALHAMGEPWTPWGVTWDTRPNHRPDTILGQTNGPDVNVQLDMSAWVTNWANGTWPNDGIEMDTEGQGDFFVFGATCNGEHLQQWGQLLHRGRLQLGALGGDAGVAPRPRQRAGDPHRDTDARRVVE